MSDKYAFTRSSAQRIAQVVRDAENMPTPIRGESISVRKGRNAVAFENKTGLTIPRGAIVWLRELQSGILGGYVVEYAGITRFGIASNEVAVDEIGSVFTSGTCPVMVDAETYANYNDRLYYRLSVKGDRWTPVFTRDWGKMMIVGKTDEYPYLMVEIDGGYAHARRVG